jgi:hypothetical protein
MPMLQLTIQSGVLRAWSALEAWIITWRAGLGSAARVSNFDLMDTPKTEFWSESLL